jgi:solute carrier family 25 carnitine/acylcarnitine transporter 20/29
MNNEFIYGLCGGSIGVLLSHPFDTIKTRVQTNNISISDAIKQKYLYRGIYPPLFGVMLEKSIVFGFYEKSKQIIKNDFINGLIGGLVCSIIVTPIEKVKIHYQNKSNIPLNIKTIYNGFIPTIMRETPGFGIYFTTYNYLNNNYNMENNNLMKNFLFGSISGLSAWTFIYPADMVKTIIQSDNNTNIKNVINNIYNRGGLKGFYKGFSLACMRCIPLHGGVFLGYEMSKKYL